MLKKSTRILILSFTLIWTISNVYATTPERDAKADITPLLWEMGGVCILGVSYMVGGLAGFAVDDGKTLGPSETSMYCMGFGSVGICIGTYVKLGYENAPIPPAKILLRKSPEYVKVYTETYKEERLRLRRENLGKGMIGGLLAGAVSLVLLIELK